MYVWEFGRKEREEFGGKGGREEDCLPPYLQVKKLQFGLQQNK